MSEQQRDYVIKAALVIAVLIAGFFGIILPVQPEIPSPLPTPTPVSLDDVYIRLQGLETTQGIGDPGESFAIRERISIDARDDAYFYNGADTIWYSDNHSTEKVKIAGDSGNVTVAGALAVTGAVDVGGTLTVSTLVSQAVGFSATAATSLVSTTVTGPLTATTLVVTGASDLVGNVSSSTGAVSVTDNLYVSGTSDLVGNVSSSTGAVTVSDALNVTGAVDLDSTLNVDGASTLVGDVTLSALLKPAFGDVTITDGYVLTPTKTVYALDSSGAVTLTLAASASEGQLLILIGDDANTVTIADTNVRTSTGAALELGQYDTVAFVYQDSEWLELWLLANQ